MSDFTSEEKRLELTRRDFLNSALATAVGFCLLDCAAISAQQQQQNASVEKALDDPNVIHGKVSFKSGAGIIDGYLSRPKAKGRFHAVLVIAGNSIVEEYIPNTTAMLAQRGFVGFAPNIYSLQNDTMSPAEKQQIFAEKITDELIFRDIQSGIKYLKQQKFIKRKHFGITGFCFGGRCALMFAVRSKEIKAVAPFYGNLTTPPSANRKLNPVDVIAQIKVPVQGHYAKEDNGIPPEQLKKFESDLKAQGTPVEIFSYDAPHGFFAYTRHSYNSEATKLAWERTVNFLQQNLK